MRPQKDLRNRYKIMIQPIVSSEGRPSGYLLASVLLLAPTLSLADAAGDFATHCASCYGDQRLGGTGPALIRKRWAG